MWNFECLRVCVGVCGEGVGAWVRFVWLWKKVDPKLHINFTFKQVLTFFMETCACITVDITSQKLRGQGSDKQSLISTHYLRVILLERKKSHWSDYEIKNKIFAKQHPQLENITITSSNFLGL